MSALLLLAVCLSAGLLVSHLRLGPPELGTGVSWFALNVALPALILHLVPPLRLETALWYLPASQWLVFAGAWLVVAAVGQFLHWTPSRTGAVVLVAGLSNTAFLGYPLIETLRGHEALRLAIIADQMGSFIVLATLGIFVASLYAGKRVSAGAVARRVLTFPAFIAVVVAFVAGRLGGFPAGLDDVLARLGATLSPIVLFAVGLQLRWRASRAELSAMAIALGWKLVAAPLVVCGLGIVAHVRRDVLDIAVLQAAMAPMVSATLLAEQEKLEPRLATAILGAGILLSLATVPLFAYIATP